MNYAETLPENPKDFKNSKQPVSRNLIQLDKKIY